MAIRRLRTYKLKERYALLFLLIGLPFMGLAFWPDGVGWLAERLGIQYTTLALVCISVFLFLVVFELLSIVSVQDQKITSLAQMVGILVQQQKAATAVADGSPSRIRGNPNDEIRNPNE